MQKRRGRLDCTAYMLTFQVASDPDVLKDTIAVFFFVQTVSYNAMGCSSWGMDLVSHVSGKFTKGLMVFGTAECIRLFASAGILCLNILAGSG